eukprot:381428-Pelagomonas_calceolata.AAC.1
MSPRKEKADMPSTHTRAGPVQEKSTQGALSGIETKVYTSFKLGTTVGPALVGTIRRMER